MLWFEDILKIALGSFRMGGLLIAMPGFSGQTLPGPVKLLFPILFSILILHFQAPIPSELWKSNGVLLTVVAREAGIGLFIGFAARLIFLSIQGALEWSSLQMGFSLASLFDPQNNSYVSALAELGTLLMTLLFLAANLHHDLFQVLVKSYQGLPIGLPQWEMGGMKDRLVEFLRTSFEISFRLAAPVLVAMLVIQAVIGVMSKTAPQMNLFFNMAFVVNIIVGFILVLTTFPHMVSQFQAFAHEMARKGYGLF